MSDMKQYPGMVCLRELPEGLVDWEKVEKNLKGAFGFDVVRLHLELMREHPEEQRPDNGPYETKQESLAWAKGLGWKDKVRVETLL